MSSGTVLCMTSKTTGATVGENLRAARIQAGEDQSQCATRLRRHGLDWSRDKVASTENGRRGSIAVEELLILSVAYKVPLAEWFAGEGQVQVTPEVAVDRDEVRKMLQGKMIKNRPVVLDFTDVEDLEADERAATRWGVDQDQVTATARELWGHTLTAERNARLAELGTKTPKELRTLRAGMTKRLMREIEEAMSE